MHWSICCFEMHSQHIKWLVVQLRYLIYRHQWIFGESTLLIVLMSMLVWALAQALQITSTFNSLWVAIMANLCFNSMQINCIMVQIGFIRRFLPKFISESIFLASSISNHSLCDIENNEDVDFIDQNLQTYARYRKTPLIWYQWYLDRKNSCSRGIIEI